MQSNFAKRQFEFVVFVSYIVLLHFIPVVLNLSTHSYPHELSLNFLVPLVWNQIVIDTNTISLQRYSNAMNLQ